MPQTLEVPGLTTGRAPFVEEARNRGDLYITQDYSLYSSRRSYQQAFILNYHCRIEIDGKGGISQ